MTDLVYEIDYNARYVPSLRRQRVLHETLVADRSAPDRLMLLQYGRPVITLGTSSDRRNILEDDAALRSRGVEVHQLNRGGDVTAHGPGQLVAYPIFRLDRHGRDLHGFVRNLEVMLIRLLGRFNIRAVRREGLTGVWVDDAKIAAIGIAVRAWVSYHGVSLNISDDLSLFDPIVPCGISEAKLTSIHRLIGRAVAIEDVGAMMIESVGETFGHQSISCTPLKTGG